METINWEAVTAVTTLGAALAAFGAAVVAACQARQSAQAFRAQILFQYWRDGLGKVTGTARLTKALKAELPPRLHAIIDELGKARTDP